MKKLSAIILSFGFIAHALAAPSTATAATKSTNPTTIQAPAIPIKLDVDYKLISTADKPARGITTKAGKVNVTEFYSYHCIHCQNLEPVLDAWIAKTKNVDLNRIQVVWEGNFVGFAKINATANILNLSTQFYQQVFNWVIDQRKNLEDPDVLKQFLAANKNLVNPQKFMATYNSFTVDQVKPKEYEQYTKSYKITGTPTFIIANKYITQPAQPERLIQVVQALVDQVKKEQKIK